MSRTLLTKNAGWILRNGTLVEGVYHNHIESLITALPEFQQRWNHLTKSQQEEIQAVKIERESDPTDLGYGWHVIEHHHNLAQQTLRSVLVNEAYKMGVLRVGIAQNTLCIEGTLDAIQRQKSRVKKLAEDIGLERETSMVVDTQIMQIIDQNFVSQLTRHLQSPTPANRAQLITALPLLGNKYNRGATQVLLTWFPNLEVQGFTQWSQTYGNITPSLRPWLNTKIDAEVRKLPVDQRILWLQAVLLGDPKIQACITQGTIRPWKSAQTPLPQPDL